MGPPLQNLRTKGLMGKIFWNKELGEASRWRVEVFSAGCVEETLGTVPLCAFCILGKGCSSQECGIFLWKAVEKGQNIFPPRVRATSWKEFRRPSGTRVHPRFPPPGVGNAGLFSEVPPGPRAPRFVPEGRVIIARQFYWREAPERKQPCPGGTFDELRGLVHISRCGPAMIRGDIDNSSAIRQRVGWGCVAHLYFRSCALCIFYEAAAESNLVGDPTGTLGVSRRHRSQEWIQGADGRWHRESRAYSVVIAGDDVGVEGPAVDEGNVVAMDEREADA